MTETMTPDTLRARFAQERASGKRAIDAAHAIGLSEGAAVAAHVGAPAGQPGARAIRGDWLELLRALEACGPLLALTRNPWAVHETTGVYRNVNGDALSRGIALGDNINLRFFFLRWHAAYAVTGMTASAQNGEHASLQIFDIYGNAVHKIFVREGTDLAAWRAVLARFDDAGAAPAPFKPVEARPPQRNSVDIDREALLRDWAALQDVHDFFDLLKNHGIGRQQGFQLTAGRFTQELTTESVHALLTVAAEDQVPIMPFVINSGCAQIYGGPVHNIKVVEHEGARWLNVLDPGFNLHLREDAIARVWAVQKPTADGVVTSVEAFDADDQLVVMFYGLRERGVPELPSWRALVERLPRVALKAAA